MPAFLLFSLWAPLAAMGDVAVGERRTGLERPGKSAVLGLVAAGYHYPADVVAGFFVGWVSAAGVAVVLPMGK